MSDVFLAYTQEPATGYTPPWPTALTQPAPKGELWCHKADSLLLHSTYYPNDYLDCINRIFTEDLYNL